MNESSLGHVPSGERWEFDESVASVFDDMLARSIPQYEMMREIVFRAGCDVVSRDTTIVDLGCSDGLALAPFVEKFGAYNSYLGCDVSEPMMERARSRFASYPSGLVRIEHHDLRFGLPVSWSPWSLCLLNLTLMFVPINYRAHIVEAIYTRLNSGGALILVEKLLGQTAKTDALLVREYHELKARNGYSADEIERKRLSLEGVQVPITAAWNEAMLRDAGFRDVECIWRCWSFAAWVAIKRG